MRGPCGPRKTLPGGPAAFFGTAEPFKLQYFVFGVRVDPAATKLVSFFVNEYEG